MIYLSKPFTFETTKETFATTTERINLLQRNINTIYNKITIANKNIVDLGEVSKHNILRICQFNKTITEMR